MIGPDSAGWLGRTTMERCLRSYSKLPDASLTCCMYELYVAARISGTTLAKGGSTRCTAALLYAKHIDGSSLLAKCPHVTLRGVRYSRGLAPAAVRRAHELRS